MTEDVYTELSSLRHMLSPRSCRSSGLHASSTQPLAAEGDSRVIPRAAEPEYDSVLQGTQVLDQQRELAYEAAKAEGRV